MRGENKAIFRAFRKVASLIGASCQLHFLQFLWEEKKSFIVNLHSRCLVQ